MINQRLRRKGSRVFLRGHLKSITAIRESNKSARTRRLRRLPLKVLMMASFTIRKASKRLCDIAAGEIAARQSALWPMRVACFNRTIVNPLTGSRLAGESAYEELTRRENLSRCDRTLHTTSSPLRFPFQVFAKVNFAQQNARIRVEAGKHLWSVDTWN